MTQPWNCKLKIKNFQRLKDHRKCALLYRNLLVVPARGVGLHPSKVKFFNGTYPISLLVKSFGWCVETHDWSVFTWHDVPISVPRIVELKSNLVFMLSQP